MTDLILGVTSMLFPHRFSKMKYSSLLLTCHSDRSIVLTAANSRAVSKSQYPQPCCYKAKKSCL